MQRDRPWMRCDNLNHLRPNAPIRHCPQCGGTVNAGHPASRCEATTHATRRKQQSNFCVDCGAELIARSPGIR
jgi:hypothetical protein